MSATSFRAAILIAAVVACSGGEPPDPPTTTTPDPTPLVESGGVLLFRSFANEFVGTYVEIWGEAAIVPAGMLAREHWPRVTWENVTTGGSGDTHVSQECYLANCSYPFWVQIPVPTYGTHTIVFRGYYDDGRWFAEKRFEVLRLEP